MKRLELVRGTRTTRTCALRPRVPSPGLGGALILLTVTACDSPGDVYADPPGSDASASTDSGEDAFHSSDSGDASHEAVLGDVSESGTDQGGDGDECGGGLTCSPNATCVVTPEGSDCVCNGGYVGDGIACCDGTEDATECLQAAIDKIHDQGGGTLQLPSDAMFRISSMLWLREGVVIDGTAGEVSIEDPSLDTRATIFTNDAINLIHIEGSNAGLRDLILSRTYDDGVASSGFLVRVGGGTQHIVVDRCNLWGARATFGIFVNDPYVRDVTITNSRIRGALFGILTSTNNYDWASVETYGAHTSHLRIEGNEIFTRGDGININSPVFNGLRPDTPTHTCTYPGVDKASGNPNVGNNDIVIRKNRIVGSYLDETKSGRGFCVALAGAKHVVIEDNDLDSCKWQAIHVEDRCYNVLIVNNRMNGIVGPQPHDESSWVSAGGSMWFHGSRGVAVVGNEIRGAHNSGIRMMPNGPPGWTCHDTEEGFNRHFRISGNQVIQPREFGYVIAGTGNDAAGIATCFGAMGPQAACNEPTWDPLWSQRFGGSTFAANAYTAGPNSDGPCNIADNVVGLTKGGAESQLCP